ncbi:MAG: ABC transporter substrate-binding protein [Alcaligenaceae bacterium]|nr:MAG: ABC transporter substrate-binding protein [Alcaligenaceae bacterium]
MAYLMNKKNIGFACIFLLSQMVFGQEALAQYPLRTIKILVGFAAGGPTDSSARALAEGMTKALGQQVLIENRPGANAQIAAIELIKSPADGYTLMLASNGTLSVAGARYAKLSYDVERDFVPIGSVAGYPHVLVVPPESPADNLEALIRLAKASPKGLTAAVTGHANELTVEWLKKEANIELTSVIYKGASAVINDLVAGRVDMALLAPNVVTPMLGSKRMKAIAVTGANPASDLPGVATMMASGLPSFELNIWNGLVAPAGTSPSIIQTLNAALRQTLELPEFQKNLALSGQYAIIDTPAEFKRKYEKEGAHWKKIATEAKLPLL